MKITPVWEFEGFTRDISLLTIVKEPRQICEESFKIQIVKQLAGLGVDNRDKNLLQHCLQNAEWLVIFYYNLF